MPNNRDVMGSAEVFNSGPTEKIRPSSKFKGQLKKLESKVAIIIFKGCACWKKHFSYK